MFTSDISKKPSLTVVSIYFRGRAGKPCYNGLFRPKGCRSLYYPCAQSAVIWSHGRLVDPIAKGIEVHVVRRKDDNFLEKGKQQRVNCFRLDKMLIY